jgi:hypothetical protein
MANNNYVEICQALGQQDLSKLSKFLPILKTGEEDCKACNFGTASTTFEVTIFQSPEFLLRAHYFEADSQTKAFHTHNSTINSLLLHGSYTSVEGVKVEGQEPAYNREYYQSGRSRLVEAGRKGVHVTDRTKYSAGDFYNIKPGKYHVLENSEPVISLVCFSPHPRFATVQNHKIIGVVDSPELREVHNTAEMRDSNKREFVLAELKKAGLFVS